jgi:hypothetical protein
MTAMALGVRSLPVVPVAVLFGLSGVPDPAEHRFNCHAQPSGVLVRDVWCSMQAGPPPFATVSSASVVC